MININKFKDFINFLSNKNGMGSPTPANFNLATERAVMEWTMKRYNNEQEYQPGRPIPRISYEITQKIIDDLHHLKESLYFNLPTSGKLPLPNGSTVVDINNQVAPEYLHLTALRSVVRTYDGSTPVMTERDIQITQDSKWGRRIESSIRKPDLKYPIANVQNIYIEILPKTIQMVRMTYLRYPQVPIWAYTLSNNRPVYDTINSVDIDAPNEAMNEIAMSTLSFLGINLREPDLVQYAETLKAKGV